MDNLILTALFFLFLFYKEPANKLYDVSMLTAKPPPSPILASKILAEPRYLPPPSVRAL